jgi:Flp pilus assembly protein TadG
MPGGSLGGERGAAIAEFALVSALLAALVLGVLQLALALHVRNTLIDAAAEGARYAALLDATPRDGEQRTRALIAAALTPEYARDVRAAQRPSADGPIVEVSVRATLPVLGLLGPAGALEVTGRAPVETLE